MAGASRLLLILLGVTACAGARTVPEGLQVPAGNGGLGQGDVFEVRVYGEEGLSAQYRVEQDGTIDFPFLGRVAVEGREPREVASAIAEGLREREILIDPQVTVFVSESNSLRVTVMGAVARAGTFPIEPGMTVLQAISSAGGFSNLASQNDTVLTRRTPEGVQRFTVPARRISDGREPDVPLRGGDIIFVPERAF